LPHTDAWCRLAVVEVPDVHYVRNGDVALAYQVFGDGPVELVYAPQWINKLEVAWGNPLFARFLKRRASFARVVFVDRRGMGLSDRLSATDAPPLETLMEDLRVVIDSAEFKRPVLFGGSDAGCICALFAATHPDLTSALIVYGPEARGTASSDYPWAWTAEEWEVYLAGMDAGWGTDEYTGRMVERHHTVVRAMLGRYRGVEQDVAGDGFFATFDGPARGVKCARAIMDVVRSLELEVRAGVHTGEVGMTGEKASGIAVNVAARIAALAEPSEILVSQTVKDLVAGSGLRFLDRGNRELKGVEGTWNLYAVAASMPSGSQSF
jgi:pimeloyl-ACP methyl ester carboxylesterase